ncbi:TonB-dependent receptor [Colwellia sp. E2M01]|uniref:TonB-dependent receptor plug domain-containing protein n=1 Tax=Colwellia sp. E2M01 TaxID=2841561 RepID=UPI001C095A1A|nr:TonB-dependent receptor [Colwellia sp. E2M01]MBU2869323.1 TonB-dependent receptor [Colwellia sp. E2M01]
MLNRTNHTRLSSSPLILLGCATLLMQGQVAAQNNENRQLHKPANALPTAAEQAVSKQSIEVIEVVNSHDFASSNYEILRREDFVDSAQNLSDILGQVNGIQIRQISGLGNPVSISIRGSSAKQVQFYIDGQLVNDSQFGSFDLNQIPTEQIESIEISKNQAIGTGSTPIGGVIRINTYNPSKSNYKISAALGSFGYQELSLMKNTAFKHHSLAIGGTYLASENDYDYLVPQSFNDPNQSITEPLINNEFEKISLFINDSAQIDQHQLRLNINYNKQDKAQPNYQNNTPKNSSNVAVDNLRFGMQYNWISSIKYIDTLELDFYNDNKNERYINSPNQFREDISDYKTNNQHLGVKPNFTFRNFTFSPSINATNQEFESFSTKNGVSSDCNGISTCDTEAKQDQLNVGARLAWQGDSVPFYTYVLANKLSEKNSHLAINNPAANTEYSNLTYNTQEFGLSWGDKKLNSAFNWSNGVRTPTLYELFGDSGTFKGNDNLQPEEAETYSLSLKYQNSVNKESITPFVSMPLNFSSSVYYQSLENAIVAIFNSSGTGSYTNVSNAELIGLELQAGGNITSKLTFSLLAQLIDSDTQSQYVAFNDKKLPGIYHQQYGASLSYQLNKAWNININSNIDKDLYFNRSNQFETNNTQNKTGNPANRSVTDLSVRWKVKKYTVHLSCLNLFDNQYQDLANRPAQGRSIQLKFSIEDI